MFSSEQQVGKGEYTYGWYSASGGRMHGNQERLRFITVSIFSWSYFISELLLTRYKFIPTHLSIKDISSYQNHRNHKLKLFFKFDYHMRVQAVLDREHG